MGPSVKAVYASVLDFYLTDHEFEELFGNAAEQGCRAFKIEVGHSDIARDLHRLSLLHRATGSRGAVMIDANEAWTTQEASDAIQMSKRKVRRSFGRAPAGEAGALLERPLAVAEEIGRCGREWHEASAKLPRPRQ